VVLGGDARCDSPGYSAKYGSYTLMDLVTKKILDFQLVQVCMSNLSYVEIHVLEQSGLFGIPCYCSRWRNIQWLESGISAWREHLEVHVLKHLQSFCHVDTTTHDGCCCHEVWPRHTLVWWLTFPHRNMTIDAHWCCWNKSSFSVLDVGFGLGTTVLANWQYLV
jgi:hypothetical protein